MSVEKNISTRQMQLEAYLKRSLVQMGIKEGSNSKPGDGNYSAILGSPQKTLVFNK